jgi:hypothetical protein
MCQWGLGVVEKLEFRGVIGTVCNAMRSHDMLPSSEVIPSIPWHTG